MKRFDLQQIMKQAHRTYRYVGKKQGKSFSEILKSTWRMARMNVEIEEMMKRQEAELMARNSNRVKAVVLDGDFKGEISDTALYGMNYTRTHFVND